MKKTRKAGGLRRRLISAALCSVLCFTTVNALAEAPAGRWYTDFGSYEAEKKSAGELTERIMEEGAVLLKNDGILPLAKSIKNVTLFGARSFDPVTGGTGSGGGGGVYTTLPDSMEAAGFKINDKVKTMYENNRIEAATYTVGYKAQTVESPAKILNSTVGSYELYGDMAIITIARTGGEGDDLYTQNIATHKDKTEHYLQLDDNEKDMIAHVKEHFDKVVVLLNIANPMEISDLVEDPAINAILWIGQPGLTGLKAVPKILKGEVNPSGRLVDIFPRDFTTDPTWQNFGTLYQHNEIDPETGEFKTTEYGTRVRYMKDGEVAEVDLGSPMFSAESIEYEEGIYMGYKYYETADAEAKAGNYEGFDYDKEVVYPFGYGLSYTNFSQEFVTTAEEWASAVNAASKLDDKVQVQVKVTNTGDKAGKDVVQLYIHAPYTKGGIEKAEVALAGFGKTNILEPGESEVVTVDVRLGDIASFDYNDANQNGYKGWEIEAGDYELRLQKNSHEMIASLGNALEAKTKSLDNDEDETNNTPLSEGDHFDSLLNIKSTDEIDGKEYHGTMQLMSRADFKGTFPTATKAEDLIYSKEVADLLSFIVAADGERTAEGRYTDYYNSSDDLPTDPWYKTNEDIPEGWTQAVNTDDRENGMTAIQLRQMAGIDYLDTDTALTLNGVEYASGQAAWEAFMNQLTYDEMITVLSQGGFGDAALASVGKDASKDADGPAQLSKGTYWCCEVVIASTWNTDLAYEQGIHIGNESLFQGVTGWYGPGLNIHRSPFSGRNFEYYSQDALQGGVIAAAVVKGAESRGCNVFMKHFALNDQEKNRGGLATFASEQAIRENYLKVFEYATKEGKASAVMTAFNRIGVMNEYCNYVTLNTILRGEWGFRGTAVTDAYQAALAKANYMIRGGCERPLGNYSGQNVITGEWDETLRGGKGGVRDGIADAEGKLPESATQYAAVRECATRALWAAANTNVNKNSLDKSAFSYQDDVVWFAGIDGGKTGITPVSVAIDTEKFGTEDIVYTADGLPAGLSLSASGNIVGTTMELGTYDITVNMVADGWINQSVPATLRIDSLYESTAELKAKAGSEYSTTLSESMFKLGDMWDGGAVNDISYALVTEIPGLTMAKDGTLSGTPTTPGIYTATVRTTLAYIRMRPRTANFDSVITFVVTDAEGNVPEVTEP